MDLAPVGRSGLQCSQTKPLQQDPDTLKQKGEQQKERNAGEGETRLSSSFVFEEHPRLNKETRSVQSAD
ncbi:hypothetical protein EYF80_017306 [Liparis tanakae]|uniref:Uncharacterized protein n=1 Tax=Liparis tanakae TaxID=230148 RepID=A0A4Z2I3Y3_9TELE|nr:hypothetical protein EYF80_017306 [Liparis tanakae]